MIFSSRSDTWLVHRALAGEASAFEALILRHARKAHAIARARGVEPSLVDDVVQESFLQAFRDLGSLKDAGSFLPWLLGIVRHSAARLRRRTEPRPAAEPPLEPVSMPADRLEGEELRQRVRRKVDDLPEGVREAIFLYYYEGRSTREAAMALGTTRAGVKKRLQRGRDLLREDLWRELEAELRDLLPSARAWREKARGLALLAAVALPASKSSRTVIAAGGSPLGGVKATAAPWLLGGLIMSGKKMTLAVAVLALLVVTAVAVHRFARIEEPPALAGRAASPAQASSHSTAVEDPARVEALPAAESKVALRVRVVGADGAPLERARVHAAWSRAHGQGRLVDGRSEVLPAAGPGEFVSPEVKGDGVTLLAVEPLHLERLEERAVPPEGLSEWVTLELEAAEVASFRLIDPLGGDRPVGGARAGPIAGDMLSPHRGAPVPPVDLDARRKVDRLYEVESSDLGEFRLARVPGTLWVTRAGYAPTAVRFFGNTSSDPAVTYTIPMYPPTRLRIAVQLEGGEPVEGFQYSLAEEAWGLSGDFRRTVEGTRAEHEIYTLCDLSPEARLPETLILGVASGVLEARETFKVRHGQENPVEVTLRSWPTAIHGRVLDAEGRAVAGAKVVAFSGGETAYILDDEIRQAGTKWVTETGAGGGYEIVFPDEPAPVYLLVGHPEHPFHVSERLRLERNRRRRHDVELPAPATLTARLAESLSPRAGVEVELTNEGSEAHPIVTYRRKGVSDADGRAHFAKVHAGTWTLSWTESRITRRLHVAAEAGRSYEVLLGPDPARSLELSGILTAGGRSVEGMDLWLWEGETDEVIGITTSGAGGAFSFERVPPGAHRLAVSFGGKTREYPLHYHSVEAHPGASPLGLDLTMTTATGRVVSEEGPLDTVTVRPWTLQPLSGREVLASFHSAQTDAKGIYRLPGLYGCPTVLLFEKPGYIPVRVPWVPSGALEVELPDVRLEKLAGSGGIRLRVVETETGEEVDRVLVEILAIDGEAPLSIARFARQDRREELVSSALPAGRYLAFVRPGTLGAEEFTSEEVEITHAAGAEEDVLVRCRRAGTAVLELVTEEGPLPAVATVRVLAGDRRVLTWQGGSSLRFQGSAYLGGLPLGELTVRVEAQGWRPLEFPLEVERDRVARIRKTIERE